MAARSSRPAAAAGTSTVRVTWVHSLIGHNAGAHGTIRALGLHRLHETVEIEDTAANRGMLRRVAFLLEVERPSGDAAKPAEGQRAEVAEPAGTTQAAIAPATNDGETT